ncbi:Desmoplakin [Lonomia obliqua multiple nucleopolyhedrovirus]|uniref:Desmoplakin n=1 Tax=Lonomia obliqua multiple nucleopolyhedrovirus TaxID=134394 RepID=A0A126FCB8_9ABAC|nr:Desmoplakin [Lonomia obliqua multiple nucleopolyhedrovirus]AKN81050.1 Desmoplakin [Lonomia obliqua multiple nucleopolyhedrovirus]
MQQLQRWPKYGNTEVNSRTVQDLLNTINTMSERIKALERYEHTLREIHKVIIILKPSTNVHGFEPDALPALVLQFLSDFVGRDFNTLTHNINYKYDYNYPQPFPGPAPSVPSTSMPPPPPPAPGQPPPQFYNYYPYYPPYQFQAAAPPPPEAPSFNINGVGGVESLKQIQLTAEEQTKLTTLYYNMQSNMTWMYFEEFLDTFISIVKVHIENNITIVNILTLARNIKLLADYNFTQFIECIFINTSIRFTINEQLCETVTLFVKFFTNIYYLYRQTTFQITEFSQMSILFSELYKEIEFKYNSSIEATNNSLIIARLQNELKKERSTVQQLKEELLVTKNTNSELQNNLNITSSQYMDISKIYTELDSQTATQRNETSNEIKKLTNTITDLNTIVSQNELAISELNSQIIILQTDNKQLNASVTELEGKLKSTVQLTDISASQLDELSALQQQINTQIEEKSNLLQKVQSQTNDIAQLSEMVQSRDVSNFELQKTYQDSQRQIVELQTKMQQITSQMSLFSDTIEAVNSIYTLLATIDPKHPTVIEPNTMKRIDVYVEQFSYIYNWFNNLKSQLSNEALFHIQAPNYFNQYSDLRTQLVQNLPLSIKQEIVQRETGIKPEQVLTNTDMSDVAIISGVNLLLDKNNELLNQNRALTDKNATLTRDLTSQLEAIQNQLKQTTDDLKQLSNLAQRDPALRNLNDESIKSIKSENDQLANRNLALENNQLNELEKLANEAVQIEISKLNTKISNVNDLFAKYDSKTKDIFEWKTKMLKMYETLARNNANTL